MCECCEVNAAQSCSFLCEECERYAMVTLEGEDRMEPMENTSEGNSTNGEE